MNNSKFEFKKESSEEMKGYLDEINRKDERISGLSLKYPPIGIPIYIAAMVFINIIYCFVKYGYVSTDHLYYPGKYAYVSQQSFI